MKLTLTHSEGQVEVTMNEGVPINVLFEAFKTCLIGAGYHIDTYEAGILMEADNIDTKLNN